MKNSLFVVFLQGSSWYLCPLGFSLAHQSVCQDQHFFIVLTGSVEH